MCGNCQTNQQTNNVDGGALEFWYSQHQFVQVCGWCVVPNKEKIFVLLTPCRLTDNFCQAAEAAWHRAAAQSAGCAEQRIIVTGADVFHQDLDMLQPSRDENVFDAGKQYNGFYERSSSHIYYNTSLMLRIWKISFTDAKA